MANRSRLLKLTIKNIGCIGPEGVEVALDDVVCLVGKNNAGKSTVLRAYELAYGPSTFLVGRDRCRWAPPHEPSIIELEVHIPEGVANIAEEWKTVEGDLRVLKSRWEWAEDGKWARKTWQPETGKWSDDGKAGGADNVFKARLPRPLRIGSLQDVGKFEETLLALALTPFFKEMQVYQGDPESDLSRSVSKLMGIVEELSRTHEQRFEQIATKVQGGFERVFPGLGIRLDVAMAAPTISIEKLMKEGSGIRVDDRGVETSVEQQGTGARRALFWSMVQVHNRFARDEEVLASLEKAAKSSKPAEANAATAKLDALKAGQKPPQAEDDPALPGYLLLIDEPENALHPMAARAAQRQLYSLAADPDWQVLMTTHSPYFVNPLADHTTIVRLERSGGDQGALERKTYRTEDVAFDVETKRNLQALQQMDVGFSEIFFGSYPILVEGDTEHAAFIAAIVETNHALAERATVVRARGKGILPGLIRMLCHFHVPFSIIHDIDWPFTEKGGKNGMWTTNQTIHDELRTCREKGLTVRHRCSVPDFERHLGGEELGKDKPLQAYLRIKGDAGLRERVAQIMVELCECDEHQPFGYDASSGQPYIEVLRGQLVSWAAKNGAATDVRLVGGVASAAQAVPAQ